MVNALRLLGIGILFVLIGIIFANAMGEVTAAIVSTIIGASGSLAWELPKLLARKKHDLTVAALSESKLTCHRPACRPLERMLL